SAAAVVRGFVSHDPALRIAGVVLNRAGSERHRRLTADAITRVGLPVLGALPRDSSIALPDRHLGLDQAIEHADLLAYFERLADVAARPLDMDAMVASRGSLTVPPPLPPMPLRPPGQRIALASDQAFSFTYPHIVDGWRRAGAEIVGFSPLADEPPPAS